MKKELPPALTPMKVRAGAKYDWPAIRHDFVVMGATREQVLQKYALPPRAFERRAKQGGWHQLKGQLEDRFQHLTKGIPEVPDSVLEAVDHQWKQRFRELEQMAVYVQRWIAAHTLTGTPEPVQLARLTKAQKDIIQMQRLLMDQSTEIHSSVDKGVESLLAIVEKYVPEADKERFKDDVTRFVSRGDGRPSTPAAPQPR